MKKLFMFDLDGTVLDTEKDLLLCANELFAKCGYPQIDIARVKQANGKDADLAAQPCRRQGGFNARMTCADDGNI